MRAAPPKSGEEMVVASPADPPLTPLEHSILACRLCRDRFAATQTAHAPRPVLWFHPEARILIAGQAPGLRVHDSRRPFDDRSGDRLRAWMGISTEDFYNRRLVAFVPAAFCFPGYNAEGSDLPPPPLCARTWQQQVMGTLGRVELTLLLGAHAHRNHLGIKSAVNETVSQWQTHAPDCFPLPHPSWRNTAWIKKNPWFETVLLPALRARVDNVLRS